MFRLGVGKEDCWTLLDVMIGGSRVPILCGVVNGPLDSICSNPTGHVPPLLLGIILFVCMVHGQVPLGPVVSGVSVVPWNCILPFLAYFTPGRC